jgi:hypothetical protein
MGGAPRWIEMPKHNQDTETSVITRHAIPQGSQKTVFVIPILLNTRSPLCERGGYMYSLDINMAQSKLQTGKTTLTPMYSR